MKRPVKTILIIVVSLIAVCVASSATISGKSPSGIDVSHHQGTIDWGKVAKTKGLEYVYIKASEGKTFTDPMYKKNIAAAKKAGLRVGAYHFYSEASDITAQFNHFKSLYPKESADLIPMLDIEPKGKVNAVRMKKIREDVKTFQNLCVQYYGKKPMLYIAPLLAGKTWLASLIDAETKLYIGHPYPRSPRLQGGRHYTIWQYSYSGKIDGIKGSVDLSLFNSPSCIHDIEL